MNSLPPIVLANKIIHPEDEDVRLHYAALEGDTNKLQLLLRTEPNLFDMLEYPVRPIGCTPLRLATTGGHVGAIQFLLDCGASINKPDIKAQTSLFIAVTRCDYASAKLLLQRGADPNGDDGNRCSPLYMAAHCGWFDGVKLLLQYGADTELPNRILGNVSSPLAGFLSEIKNSFDRRVESYQQSAPVAVNVVDSPLQTAVAYQHLDCFVALLLAGAQLNLHRVVPSLPDTVIAKMSVAHTMVSRCDDQRFAVLFVQFGGYLWQRDIHGRLATELPCSSTCKAVLAEWMERPLDLQSLCQIIIRQFLRKRLHLLQFLPLPQQLLDYLQYKNTIPEGVLL